MARLALTWAFPNRSAAANPRPPESYSLLDKLTQARYRREAAAGSDVAADVVRPAADDEMGQRVAPADAVCPQGSESEKTRLGQDDAEITRVP